MSFFESPTRFVCSSLLSGGPPHLLLVQNNGMCSEPPPPPIKAQYKTHYYIVSVLCNKYIVILFAPLSAHRRVAVEGRPAWWFVSGPTARG